MINKRSSFSRMPRMPHSVPLSVPLCLLASLVEPMVRPRGGRHTRPRDSHGVSNCAIVLESPNYVGDYQKKQKQIVRNRCQLNVEQLRVAVFSRPPPPSTLHNEINHAIVNTATHQPHCFPPSTTATTAHGCKTRPPTTPLHTTHAHSTVCMIWSSSGDRDDGRWSRWRAQ